ncbi:MAG TPA: DUF5615 family PIN-like protein [Phycisphaerae bacterium]
MAKLYSNENFPMPVVIALRALGHDVLTVLETGKSDQAWPDEAVLEFAHREGRCLLTLNRKHFIRLHQAGKEHSGIIVCTVDLDFSGQAARIHQLIGYTQKFAGQLLRIYRPASGA